MASPEIDAATRGRPLLARLVPLLILAVLVLLTLLVWRQQMSHQRTLLSRHTQDICYQASRRIAVHVSSLMRGAAVFGRRWSTHEGQDHSQKRFEDFGAVLTEEIPGYHSLRLMPAGKGPQWVAPPGVVSVWSLLGVRQASLLARARQEGTLVLSGPVRAKDGQPVLFAALPLQRGPELLGNLVVELWSHELIGDAFGQRLKAEFNLEVRDGDVSLFRFTEPAGEHPESRRFLARVSFAVAGRTWTVSVIPRLALALTTGWSANLAVLALGILLSLGVSGLTHLLSRRLVQVRDARDSALREVAERERAERAMRVSESRYRSVFRSATDGLLVLDHEGRIVEANPAACAMHGYGPEEFMGLPVRELISPAHRHHYEEFVRQMNDFGSARLDSVNRGKDGSTLEVEVRGTTFSYGGEPRVLAILTDVSDLRRAVQRHTMLSRKVLMAQEEERARLSRDLHDELGQILTALRLELEWLRRKSGTTANGASAGFDNAVQMVEGAAEELRRICRGLRPPLLDDLGLEPAVRLLVEEFEERTRITTDVEILIDEGEVRIPAEVALCAYRILQESLNNVSRHSSAREVNISLVSSEQELMLSIYDDGRGFDAKSREALKGFGIAGMRERASLVNGTVDIRSENLQGTRVAFRVPLVIPVRKESNDQGPDS